MYNNFKIRKNDVKIGTKICCVISGYPVRDAKIQIENGIVYVCQNEKIGDPCSDKLGYDYSWSIANYDLLTPDGISVDDFFMRTYVNKIYVIVQEWDEVSNEKR